MRTTLILHKESCSEVSSIVDTPQWYVRLLHLKVMTLKKSVYTKRKNIFWYNLLLTTHVLYFIRS